MKCFEINENTIFFRTPQEISDYVFEFKDCMRKLKVPDAEKFHEKSLGVKLMCATALLELVIDNFQDHEFYADAIIKMDNVVEFFALYEKAQRDIKTNINKYEILIRSQNFATFFIRKRLIDEDSHMNRLMTSATSRLIEFEVIFLLTFRKCYKIIKRIPETFKNCMDSIDFILSSEKLNCFLRDSIDENFQGVFHEMCFSFHVPHCNDLTLLKINEILLNSPPEGPIEWKKIPINHRIDHAKVIVLLISMYFDHMDSVHKLAGLFMEQCRNPDAEWFKKMTIQLAVREIFEFCQNRTGNFKEAYPIFIFICILHRNDIIGFDIMIQMINFIEKMGEFYLLRNASKQLLDKYNNLYDPDCLAERAFLLILWEEPIR
jgi:hypothetical protein